VPLLTVDTLKYDADPHLQKCGNEPWPVELHRFCDTCYPDYSLQGEYVEIAVT